MPSVQRGSLDKRGRTWRARYRDETGALRSCSGFATKSEAGEWLDSKLDTITALRRGDVATVRRQAMPTLQELVDEYVEQHSAEANTIRTLKPACATRPRDPCWTQPGASAPSASTG